MDMANERLKPCPFCGGNTTLKTKLTEVDTEDEHFIYRVMCSDWRCEVESATFWFTSPDAAIATWNRRAERTCEVVYEDSITDGGGYGDAWARCSACGSIIAVLTDGDEIPKYCPECGARVVRGDAE